MERRGLFVGIGIDAYDSHEPLQHAVAEVNAVAGVLRADFAGEPLLDPDLAHVVEHLKTVPACLDTGSLVMLWCGHGVQSGTKLWLQTRDARGEINAADVIARCAKSGANQLLFIVDTCQAGAGVAEAGEVASALLEELPPNAEHVWFGILVSCSATDIGARDGAFGESLLRLFREGPRSPDMRRRWSKHDRWIRGDDLGQAVLEDWTGEDQRPDFLRRGRAWYMLRNPLWDQGAPEEVVEHLLLAARGGTSADHRSWFTGRETEVTEVVSWVRAREPGVRVVTGSAGTGKSAIVGRVVSLSNPGERERLAEGGALEGHADPGLRSVGAHVHARGLTADRTAELLDGQLVRAEVLTPGERERRNAAELVGALQRAAEGRRPPPVLVVDGLDEARGEAFDLADLVVRLAPYASIVVSTRPVHRADPPTSLIEALQARAVMTWTTRRIGSRGMQRCGNMWSRGCPGSPRRWTLRWSRTGWSASRRRPVTGRSCWRGWSPTSCGRRRSTPRRRTGSSTWRTRSSPRSTSTSPASRRPGSDSRPGRLRAGWRGRC